MAKIGIQFLSTWFTFPQAIRGHGAPWPRQDDGIRLPVLPSTSMMCSRSAIIAQGQKFNVLVSPVPPRTTGVSSSWLPHVASPKKLPKLEPSISPSIQESSKLPPSSACFFGSFCTGKINEATQPDRTPGEKRLVHGLTAVYLLGILGSRLP